MPEDYLPALRLILVQASRQSPTVLTKNLELAQAEASRHRSEAPLYPQLGGNASYYASASSVASAGRDSSSSSSGLSYGVNVSQNLFQFGAVKAGADIARIGQKIAESQYLEAYRTLAVTIRGQYLNLVIRKGALRTSRYRLELQEQDYREKIGAIERGEIAQAERGGLEIERERARLAQERQEQEYDNARRILVRLAGLEDLPDNSIPEEMPVPRAPDQASSGLLAAYLGGGVEKTPQAQVLAFGVRQSQLNVTIAKTGTLPRFTLGGGYALGNSTSVDGLGNLSQAAVATKNYSVGMNWTLWDSGATKWNTRSALISKSNSEQALRTYLEVNRSDAEHRARNLELSYREMLLVERDRASALNSLNLEKENLGLGLVPRTAVERATMAFNAADLAAWNTRASFLQQWTEFVSQVDADPATNNLPASFLHYGQ
jgi:outer membrane protein TolC